MRKDNTGYDLKHLFIGAEGTLGIITAAVLKLFPLPQSVATACVAVRDPAAAVELLAHLRATCGDRISGFEIISRSCLDLVFLHIPDTLEPFAARHEWIVLIELSDVLQAPLDAPLRDALQAFGDGVIESEVTTDKDQAETWWKLRKNISEAQKREGISVKHDVSVPVSRVAETPVIALVPMAVLLKPVEIYSPAASASSPSATSAMAISTTTLPCPTPNTTPPSSRVPNVK